MDAREPDRPAPDDGACSDAVPRPASAGVDAATDNVGDSRRPNSGNAASASMSSVPGGAARKAAHHAANRAGADRIVGRSRSDGSATGDVRDTVATAKQSAALGAKVGGGAGAAIGATAGAVLGVVKNRKALAVLAAFGLIQVILLTAPILVIPALLSNNAAVTEATEDSRAAIAAGGSGIPEDRVAIYRHIAAETGGIDWELLAAIEYNTIADSTTTQNSDSPSGPYGLLVNEANHLARARGYAIVSRADALDRRLAGMSLAGAFKAVAEPALHSLSIDSGAVTMTRGGRQQRVIANADVDSARSDLAGRVHVGYVAAIERLPIGGADDHAERIFTDALDLALGMPLGTLCSLQTDATRPAPDGTGSGALATSSRDPVADTWVDPLNGPVASVYGWRTHPVTGKRSFHSGEDVAAPSRTPIHAAAAGTVVHSGWVDHWYGNEVAIDHGGGITTHYRHLWDDSIYVKTGQRVTAGQVIAGVGSTGTSTGPHLHLEVHKDGKPVNPTDFLATRGVKLGSSTTGPTGAIPSIRATPAAPSAPTSGTASGTSRPLTATDAAGTHVTLTPKQVHNAAIVIGVGRAVHVDDKIIEVGLITALAESQLLMWANSAVPESLHLPHDKVGSNHDSVGLFQQRPGAWGTVRDLMDPAYSARMFFGGSTKPKTDGPNGVLDIPGHDTMDPGELAQAVQVSAVPDAYDRWVPVAETLLRFVDGTATTIGNDAAIDSCNAAAGAANVNDPATGGSVAAVIKAAQSQLGSPYAFGGGGIDGCPCDCSSFMQYAFWHGAKIKLPRLTYDQITSPVGTKIGRAQGRAGDLIFFQIPGEPGWGHVGLMLSDHTMIHDPHTGDVVKVSDLNDRYYASIPQQVVRIAGVG